MIKGLAGMTGAAIDYGGDTIAVAATNWGDASLPIWAWSSDEQEWCGTQYQVADFRHNPEAALAAVLSDIIRDSGGPSEAELQESGWYDWDDTAADEYRAKCDYVADWLVGRCGYAISDD